MYLLKMVFIKTLQIVILMWNKYDLNNEEKINK